MEEPNLSKRQEETQSLQRIEVFRLDLATTNGHFDAARVLFTQYAKSLGVDLTFQNFKQELHALPGKYTSPTGCIILAYSAHPLITSNPNSTPVPIGCVGLRPLLVVSAEEKVCEMKRLYCVPEARKSGVGKALVEKVIEEVEKLGYGEMRLDTLPSLEGARILYENWGLRRSMRITTRYLKGRFSWRKT